MRLPVICQQTDLGLYIRSIFQTSLLHVVRTVTSDAKDIILQRQQCTHSQSHSVNLILKKNKYRWYHAINQNDTYVLKQTIDSEL